MIRRVLSRGLNANPSSSCVALQPIACGEAGQSISTKYLVLVAIPRAFQAENAS
jgi:hypothetical protein